MGENHIVNLNILQKRRETKWTNEENKNRKDNL